MSLNKSELYIVWRLLENQILFEEKVKGTPDDIYESEIMTPPWNTQELRDLKARVNSMIRNNKKEE